MYAISNTGVRDKNQAQGEDTGSLPSSKPVCRRKPNRKAKKREKMAKIKTKEMYHIIQ